MLPLLLLILYLYDVRDNSDAAVANVAVVGFCLDKEPPDNKKLLWLGLFFGPTVVMLLMPLLSFMPLWRLLPFIGTNKNYAIESPAMMSC